jgi:hypothetical protein
MPFTFSHPAIVLPLTYLPKRWVSLTGLVVGSMTPDFEYFIRMKLQGAYGHSLAGLFWFDLPLGLILTFLFHQMVRDSFFANLPLMLKQRLMKFCDFNWLVYFKQNWWIVVLSILVGAASHIFWDGFTHRYGYFVQMISALKTEFEIQGFHLPVYHVLQQLSTVVGGTVVVFSILKISRDYSIENSTSTQYWIIVGGLSIVISTIRISQGLNAKSLAHLVVICISAFFISLIVTPLISRVVEKRTSV